jgi:hypothetical protein
MRARRSIVAASMVTAHEHCSVVLVSGERLQQISHCTLPTPSRRAIHNTRVAKQAWPRRMPAARHFL